MQVNLAFTFKLAVSPILLVVLLLMPHVGYDASYMDPLGHMMLGSEDYRYFMKVLKQHAGEQTEPCGYIW